METVQKDVTEIHADNEENIHVLRKPETDGTRHGQQKRNFSYFLSCNSCGKTKHNQSDCYFKKAVCRVCHKNGHIQPMCRSKKLDSKKKKKERATGISTSYKKNEGRSEYELFHMCVSGKIFVTITLDSKSVRIET